MSKTCTPPTVRQDLAGLTFGFWTVLHWSRKDDSNKQYWRCRCACGTEKDVESYNLTSDRSKACRPCSAAVVGVGRRTHGQGLTKIYRAWQSMKTRCTNPNSKSWKYHGGLGVTVAPEWMQDFEAFAAHIGEPPTHLHTVDRVDAFGDYAPGNVRWATMYEQRQNTRAAMKYGERRVPRALPTGRL